MKKIDCKSGKLTSIFYGASEQRLIVSKDIVVRRPMSRFAAFQLEVDLR